MKVNHTTSNPVQANDTSEAKSSAHAHATQNAKRTEKSNSSGKVSRTEDAKTEISPRGKEFAKVREAAMDAPDVREEKIAELKSRIGGGSYRVDPHAIADRLVDEHLRSS